MLATFLGICCRDGLLRGHLAPPHPPCSLTVSFFTERHRRAVPPWGSTHLMSVFLFSQSEIILCCDVVRRHSRGRGCGCCALLGCSNDARDQATPADAVVPSSPTLPRTRLLLCLLGCSNDTRDQTTTANVVAFLQHRASTDWQPLGATPRHRQSATQCHQSATRCHPYRRSCHDGSRSESPLIATRSQTPPPMLLKEDSSRSLVAPSTIAVHYSLVYLTHRQSADFMPSYAFIVILDLRPPPWLLHELLQSKHSHQRSHRWGVGFLHCSIVCSFALLSLRFWGMLFQI